MLVFWLLQSINGVAQDQSISGKVMDLKTGVPLAGVNVFIKGTAMGTVTNSDGDYSLNTGQGTTLIFSSIGYTTQEIKLGTITSYDIFLVESLQSLDEVIITGYSVEERKQYSGAASTVDNRALTAILSSNVEQNLQGRVAGLTLITNGQPGTTNQVRIRGFGALTGNEPLYIVDGLPAESIDFLAPDDISSMTVLKDASAASIYGSRAANGVIVVATRHGDEKPGIRVSYRGMVGMAVPGNGPDLMNPQDQALWTWKAIRNNAIQNGTELDYSDPLQNGFINLYGSGSYPELPDWLLVGNETAQDIGQVDLAVEAEKYNVDIKNPPLYRVVPANLLGTDWYEAMTRSSLIQRHHIGLSNSDEGHRYYVGLNVQQQKGTMLYQGFERYSIRFNSEFDLSTKLRLGENFQASFINLENLRGTDGGAGSADGASSLPSSDFEGRIYPDYFNDMQNAYETNPLIPVFDAFGGYGGDAKVSGISGDNGVARLTRDKNNETRNVSLFGNLYLEFEPVNDLVLKSSFGGKYQFDHRLAYLPTTYENKDNFQSFSFYQDSRWQTQWTWTNTLRYHFTIGGKHALNLLLGHESISTGHQNELAGSGVNPFSERKDYISMNTVESRSVYGSHSNGVNFLSYFGNLQYAFNNKYSASLVIRRDGSSRFGKNQRWGTFPAVSIGWNLSEESWFQYIRPIDYLRVRLGYGEMGNSNNVHPDNQFNRFTTSQRASHYDIQGTNNQARQGYYRNIIGNPFGTWETAVTKNLGLDVLLWEGRFDLSLDIWTENTKDLLFQYPVTVQTGFEAIRPYVNVGEVRNQGVDLQLGTKGGIGNGLSYEIMVNGSFLKNKLISLGEGIDQIPGYSTVYSLGVNKEMIPVLNMIGHPISSFYGYRVLGLFSDQEQVSQAPVQQDAAPGRFQYQDLNTTIPYKPTIDTGDRTILGNPIADFTGGIVARFFYRNFELALYGYTSVGNEIFNLKKSSTDFFNSSGNAISERIKNSWTFENPQGGIPLFEDASNFSTNTQSNSYYVEDGSYFRMQNITLGYNVSPKLCTRWGLTNMKMTAALNNLFTITSYDGLDPMVGGNLDYNFGIDRGNYPLNTSWTLGVNVDF